MSSACFTASTYDLVAACCACVGSATLIILALFASIAPEPFGFREMFPFVFVLDNSLPFKVKLSAITAPPEIHIQQANLLRGQHTLNKLAGDGGLDMEIFWPPTAQQSEYLYMVMTQ